MKYSFSHSIILFTAFLLIIGCAGVDKAISEKDSGPRADSLAQKIMLATGHDAWQETAIVGWTFAGKNKHIWDRERKYSRVEWGKTIVIFDHTTKKGRAWKDGKPVEGEELVELIDEAWNSWANDSFWLNPFEKLYDDGTERAYVKTEDGNDALLITYTTGGNTPGDSYLWICDETGLPIAVKMWVSIIPIKGIKFSWEDWQTLETGAKTAGLHKLGFIKLKLTDIKAASSVSTFSEKDPFAEL
ncbi:MAG: hypothetical protein K9J17_10900 [Flavobacteriales bacterium]|nr:hypothetical protein [Flavobacteriales bacterium]